METETIELRVLDGPQAGARAPLGAVTMLAAGGDADGADIVLSEPESPARIRVTCGGRQALVEVLHGDIALGGRRHAAGACVVWPMHERLAIGASVIAFGLADADEWPVDAPLDATDELATVSPAAPKRRATPWLLSLAMCAALATAVLGLTQLMTARGAEAPAVSLADALRDGGEFASLAVARTAAGETELRGRLETLAQRTRLDEWLAERRLSPLVNVHVDEALARDVAEVFRVNGIAVKTRVEAPGRIAAEAAERDTERLARAEEVVRRDVRGLDRLNLVNRAVPAPTPAPPMIEDPGKRIASVVPGDPAYLVTADGSRYFVGAMLPTGHRITQIAGQRVSVERDGQAAQLNF